MCGGVAGPQFGLYDALSTLLPGPDTAAVVLRGLLSGGLSKLAVYPLDTVKRQLQSYGLVRHERYGSTLQHTSMMQCMRDIVRVCERAPPPTHPTRYPPIVPTVTARRLCARVLQGHRSQHVKIGRVHRCHVCNL